MLIHLVRLFLVWRFKTFFSAHALWGFPFDFVLWLTDSFYNSITVSQHPAVRRSSASGCVLTSRLVLVVVDVYLQALGERLGEAASAKIEKEEKRH